MEAGINIVFRCDGSERLGMGHIIRCLSLADRPDIDPNGRAQLDGRDAHDDTVVRPGQNLMFVHRAGEKGR